MVTLTILNLFLFLWLFSSYSTYATEIHKLMTDEEYKDTFGGSRDNVPDYELIQISHSINIRETNEDNPISFHAFGATIVLNLQPKVDIQIPVWLSHRVSVHDGYNVTDEVIYEKADPFIMHDALKFYEDPHNLARIAIETDEFGHFRFTGTLREALEIQPISLDLLEQWIKLFNKKIEPSPRKASQFSMVSNHHIIIKRDRLERRHLKIVHQSVPEETPIKIYPRLLIFAHYSEKYTSALELRFYKLLIYLVALWHSVNLHYRSFSDPSIKFRIAGIVVEVDGTPAPYYYDKMVPKTAGIFNAISLAAFSQSLQDNSPISRDSWDIAVMLTDFNDNEVIERLGTSYVGPDCRLNYPYTHMTALIFDNLTFYGIEVAVHELGHIFGADHDGEDAAVPCAASRSIMYPTTKTNVFEWSHCSIEAISRHIKSNYPFCWKNGTMNNSPLIGHEIPEILPGDFISPNDQCHRRHWHSACDVDERTCKHLLCYNLDIFGSSVFAKCYDTGTALEGTDCGNGKHCEAGKCVK